MSGALHLAPVYVSMPDLNLPPDANGSALYKGKTRTRTLEVYVDDVLVTTWTSSGTTDGFESIDISGMS